MSRIIRRPRARTDIEEQAFRIADDDPEAARRFLARATIIALRVPPRASAVRARYQRARWLSAWKRRKRQASWSMPRRTRALPTRARPFSRRRAPLSSGEPVSPA